MSQQKAPAKRVAPAESSKVYREAWQTRKHGGDPDGNVFSKLRDTRETNPTIKTHGKVAGRERGKVWVVKQEERMVTWVNSNLEGSKVRDLSKDLSDGMVLIRLLEKLTATKIVAKYHRKPRHRLQQLVNLEVVIKFCKNEGINLVSIDPTDIVDGNLKLILSFVNQLKLHFQHQQSTPSHKALAQEHVALLTWVNSVLPDKNISNFTTDWRDGRNLSALVDYCKPGLIPDHASLDPNNALENCTKAMEIAEKQLEIPQAMHPEFLAVESPDDFTVAFYISSFMASQQGTSTSEPSRNGAKKPTKPVEIPHPELCFATGKGISRGAVGSISEFLVDCSTARSITNSLEITVEDPNQEKLDISMTDCRDGTFKVQYSPKIIGRHTIFVNIDEMSIIDSPFICLVTNPSACVAGGTGLSTAATGHPATFQVVTTDAGPGDLSATIHGPKPVDFDRLSSENGAYSYEYSPTDKGSYHIDIKLDGQHIRGSPFSVEVIEPTVASQCFIRELPICNQRVGEVVSFIVDATQAKKDEIKAIVQGPSFEAPSRCHIAQMNLKENEKIHIVSFTPEAVGEYTVKVWYGGEPIPDSPVDFTVNDPSRCKVDTTAISKGRYYLGRKFFFRIETYDAGDGEMSCTMLGALGNYHCNVQEEDHGTKKVSFIPVETGEHKITLYFDGVLIHTIPINVHRSSFDNIVLSKPGSKYYLINEDIEFRMYAPGAESSKFAVSALGVNTGAMPHVTLTANKENYYSVVLRADYADKYRMEITYNKQQCHGSPFEILICMSPNAENVVPFDPVVPLKVDTAPIELFFDTSNAGQIGDGTLTANVTSSSGQWVIPYVEEISNDFYRVYFKPAQSDDYKINVFWYGKPVKGSPFEISFNKQAEEPSVLIRFEPEMGLRSVVSAYAEGETEGRVEVKAQQYARGKYQLSFEPAKKEVYTLHVSRFNQPIKGSPFTISLKDPLGRMSAAERDAVNSITVEVAAREGTFSAKAIGRNSGSNVQPHLAMSMNKKVVQISFIDRQSDVYDLYVYWNGVLLEGAPFEIDVS